jgi:Ni,Fe-hydrogenase I large subunit
MIWIALAIIIVGVIIANVIRQKPTVPPNMDTPKAATKAENIKIITAGIDELQDSLKKRYKDKIEQLSVEAQKQANKGVKEHQHDILKMHTNAFDDFESYVKLNAQLAEAVRYKEDELLEQQTDWFRLLEHFDDIQTLSESAHSYYEYGVDPPEPSEIEHAKALEIRKRINARAKQNKLV